MLKLNLTQYTVDIYSLTQKMYELIKKNYKNTRQIVTTML